MTLSHWFEQLCAGDLPYIFDLNCFLNYHSSLINSLLINQPFVAAITLIGYGPRCPITSVKSGVEIDSLFKRIRKKAEICSGVVTVKNNLKYTTDQLENCENRSRPKLLGDRRLIRQRSAEEGQQLVETGNFDDRSRATQLLEIDTSDDRSRETQQRREDGQKLHQGALSEHSSGRSTTLRIVKEN